MKKIISILCIAIMILGLSACSEKQENTVKKENTFVFTFADGTEKEMTFSEFYGLKNLDENKGRNREKFERSIRQGVKIRGTVSVLSALVDYYTPGYSTEVAGVMVRIGTHGFSLYGYFELNINERPHEWDLDINLDVYENDVIEFEGTIVADEYFGADYNFKEMVCLGEFENISVPNGTWNIMEHFPNVKVIPAT